MNSINTLAALAVLLVVNDVTSVSGTLNRFFSSLTQNQNRPQATCDWLKDASLLKELQWTEKADICFNTGPQYEYPTQNVETALYNDPSAQIFYNNTVSCYNYNNQQYYQPWNEVMYTQDLCPVRPVLVDKVWMDNKIDNKRDHCYIVRPQEQRVYMSQCGDGSAHPNSQKCKRDLSSYFEGNYYCVPDGYIKRVVLVYCPWNPEVQCIPAQVRIPTGCSCKQYTCDKSRYSATGLFGSLQGRVGK